jgi:hypothetical protein
MRFFLYQLDAEIVGKIHKFCYRHREHNSQSHNTDYLHNTAYGVQFQATDGRNSRHIAVEKWLDESGHALKSRDLIPENGYGKRISVNYQRKRQEKRLIRSKTLK